LSDLLADKIEASEIKKIPPQEKKKEGERRASTSSSREGKNNLASL
jgi:hypothetical protein